MDPKTEALLLSAGKSTLGRLLAQHRNRLKKRIHGKTKPDIIGALPFMVNGEQGLRDFHKAGKP